MMYNHGVHINHCCMKHGCRYNDKDCPVVLGKFKQNNLCALCYLGERAKTSTEVLTNSKECFAVLGMFLKFLQDQGVVLSSYRVGEHTRTLKEAETIALKNEFVKKLFDKV